MLSPKTNTSENAEGTVRSSSASTPRRTEAARLRLGIRGIDRQELVHGNHISRLLSRIGLRIDENGGHRRADRAPGRRRGRRGLAWRQSLRGRLTGLAIRGQKPAGLNGRLVVRGVPFLAPFR